MKSYLFYAAPLLVLLACKQPASRIPERVVQIDTMELVPFPAPELKKVSPYAVSVMVSDSTTYIRFNNCSFSLDWLIPYPHADYESRPDTLYFSLESGHTIENQLLGIQAGDLENIRVEQQYETSALINGHPSCPLTGWKHYRSPWVTLDAEAEDLFVCDTYTDTERRRFPDVDVSQLFHYVKSHYGDLCFRKIAHVSSVKESPIQVDISKYYLRISGTDKTSGEKIIKVLAVDVPLK